jgi:hypothetical protein
MFDHVLHCLIQHACIDQSSQHPHIAIKNIDWNDAIPDVRENPCAIDEIDVDLIIGADVVCVLLSLLGKYTSHDICSP